MNLKNLLFGSVTPDFDLEGLTQDDIDGVLLENRPPALLFGKIPPKQILADFEQRGLTARLTARGYSNLRATIDKPSSFEEHLRLTADHTGGADQTLLVLKAHWGTLKLPDFHDCRALVWDWLELTDPMAHFTPERPPLPGQTSPGLSMFHPLVVLMSEYVVSTEAEALMAVPLNFHNAVLYTRDPGLGFRFLDPLRQGQLLAQMRDLLEGGGCSLACASWAFEEKRVEEFIEEWKPYGWTPSELVLGLEPGLQAYLNQEHPSIKAGLSHQFRIIA
jgi:hypothetical protein